MYEKIYEQADSFFKPINEIFAINIETLDALREKQTELVNDMVADGIEYAKGVGGYQSVESLYSAQKQYWESLQNKISNNAKDALALLNESQEKIGEVIQESATWLDSKATPVASKASLPKKASKPAAKKKAAPKAAPKQEETAPAEPAPQGDLVGSE
ncbi:phasin protein [Alteromonadaceae bacterium 2753L.S.0a.02]|nr:phasin protein [Alteromonadaceae bacterium 2753L.S.0a.02]